MLNHAWCLVPSSQRQVLLHGDGDLGVSAKGLKGRTNGYRVITRKNENQHNYEERQEHHVKAAIPNFVGNLNIAAVLNWLYEVDKFFDIIDVLKKRMLRLWLISCVKRLGLGGNVNKTTVGDKESEPWILAQG
ncbi:hypothetical protein Tco_0625097 [Tanacetum coccineum]|uniref:Uncharacterized protein n=1 Tax=Tanacetum coccineum TaxID=301880 RepID=A0ABQ4WFU1_9ASTR